MRRVSDQVQQTFLPTPKICCTFINNLKFVAFLLKSISLDYNFMDKMVFIVYLIIYKCCDDGKIFHRNTKISMM